MNLNEEQIRILGYFREGFNTMAEIVDMTGWPAEKANSIIEFLDMNGLIKRADLAGSGFWYFNITKKGEDLLPPLTPEEQRIHDLGLGISLEDVKALKILHKSTEGNIHNKVIMTELIVENVSERDEQMKMVGSFMKLSRKGYIKESGFFKRAISLTDEGLRLIGKVG